jgi:hypothetical protein
MGTSDGWRRKRRVVPVMVHLVSGYRPWLGPILLSVNHNKARTCSSSSSTTRIHSLQPRRTHSPIHEPVLDAPDRQSTRQRTPDPGPGTASRRPARLVEQSGQSTRSRAGAGDRTAAPHARPGQRECVPFARPAALRGRCTALAHSTGVYIWHRGQARQAALSSTDAGLSSGPAPRPHGLGDSSHRADQPRLRRLSARRARHGAYWRPEGTGTQRHRKAVYLAAYRRSGSNGAQRPDCAGLGLDSRPMGRAHTAPATPAEHSGHRLRPDAHDRALAGGGAQAGSPDHPSSARHRTDAGARG